jgi:hypothetical protein
MEKVVECFSRENIKIIDKEVYCGLTALFKKEIMEWE